jgi:small conductance mechanosensitive channel
MALNDSIAVAENVVNTASPLVIRIISAIIILLLGFIIGRITGRLVKKVLTSVDLDKNFRKITGTRVSLERFVSGFISFIIYLAAIIMALNQLGITTVVLNIITAGIVLIVIVAFLLAVKDFIPNSVAGLNIKIKGLIKEGQSITVKGIKGKVKEVNLVDTHIITKNKELIVVPNSVFQREFFKTNK